MSKILYLIHSDSSLTALDMFSLPQPSSIQANPTDGGNIPVTEDATTMCSVLTLSYPRATGAAKKIQSLSLAHLVHLLQAAEKYFFETASSIIQDVLANLCIKSGWLAPSVYAVSCVLELEELAKSAAIECLTCSTNVLLSLNLNKKSAVGRKTNDVEESAERKREMEEEAELVQLIDRMSFKDYQRLLRFYLERVSDVRVVLKNRELDEGDVDLFCSKDGACREELNKSLKEMMLNQLECHGPNPKVFDHELYMFSVPRDRCDCIPHLMRKCDGFMLGVRLAIANIPVPSLS